MRFKGKQKEERLSAFRQSCQNNDDDDLIKGNKAVHASFLLPVLIKAELKPHMMQDSF